MLQWRIKDRGGLKVPISHWIFWNSCIHWPDAWIFVERVRRAAITSSKFPRTRLSGINGSYSHIAWEVSSVAFCVTHSISSSEIKNMTETPAMKLNIINKGKKTRLTLIDLLSQSKQGETVYCEGLPVFHMMYHCWWHYQTSHFPAGNYQVSIGIHDIKHGHTPLTPCSRYQWSQHIWKYQKDSDQDSHHHALLQ